MALPTAEEIYEELEGFGITRDVLSEKWIERKRDNIVLPFIQRVTRQTIQAETTYTEYYDGLQNSVLMLRRRPVNSIVSIVIVGAIVNDSYNLSNVELDQAGGTIKMKNSEDNYLSVTTFPKGQKNIKITYKAGFATLPDDLKQAIILLTAELCLGNIANRTGGGNALGTQGFNRQFGERGKYSSARNDMTRQAMDILRKYITGLV